VAAEIETELSTQRKVAWDELSAVLDDDRYRRLLAELHRWRSDTPLTSEAEAPAVAAKKYVKRAGKKLDKRLDRAIEAQLTGDPRPTTCCTLPARPASDPGTPSSSPRRCWARRPTS
jgi:hypothetical protein